MILITPVNKNNFKQNTYLRTRKSYIGFSSKSDSFERSIPSFKGAESELNKIALRLPVEEIEKIIADANKNFPRTLDINEKSALSEDYIQNIMELIDSKSVETNPKLFRDRRHEVINPVYEFSGYMAKILYKDEHATPADIDARFAYMTKRIANILKKYEMFIDKGLEKNNMSAKEIFSMALDSAYAKAKQNNVSINVKGFNIFENYKNKVNTSGNDFCDYELYSIFSNLAQNAAKYTKKGSSVNLEFKTQKMDNSNYLIFSVRDEGIGIPQNEIKDIFDFGKRASNAIASGIEGTGYGLKRVYKILDNIGGKLEIKSPLNETNKEFPGTEVSAYIKLND